MAKPSEQEIYNYLRSKPGVTHEHAMGIIANIKAESAYDPGVKGDFMIPDPTGKLQNKEKLVNKKGGSYVYSKNHPTKAGQQVEQNLVSNILPTAGGLFQHQGIRFEKMIKSAGNNWKTNWKGQIDFALQEQDGKNYLKQEFTSVADSTESFMINFERPADQSQKKIQSRIDGVTNLDLESNFTSGGNASTSSGSKTQKLIYSTDKGGFITEDEYKVGQVDGSIMKKKPFGYNMLSEEEKVIYDKTMGADISSLSFDDKIFKSVKTSTFLKYGKDKSGKKLTEIKGVSDEQGSAMFARTMQENFAIELGYDPKNLSDAEKIHVSLYLDKFKSEFAKVKENDSRTNNANVNTRINKDVPTNIESYLGDYGIDASGAFNTDPFVEDILDDNNFTEVFNRNTINDYAPLLDIQNKVNDIEQSFFDNGKTKFSSDELREKIKELKKLGSYDSTRSVEWNKENSEKYNTEANKIEEYLSYIENNIDVFQKYKLEGSEKIVNVDDDDDDDNDNTQQVLTLPDIEEEEEVNNEILPSLKDTFKTLEDLKTSESYLNASDEGQQQLIDGWNDAVKTEKFGGILDNKDNNQESGLPEMTMKKGLLDSIGGLGTVAAALVGAKSLKAANEPMEELDMPELSDSFKAELYQQEQLAKRGFSPDQEAAARKQISDSYALGRENAVRGTAGDRAKLLAMSGVLDSQRQAALLDFAAKDDAAQRANRDQFQKTLMFKEKFDLQNAQQLRNEELEKINNKYSTNQQLAASAFKYAMDNVNNAKADAMQNQLTQAMINDATAGYDVKEKYSSGLLGKFATRLLPGLFGNSENNTETEQ